MTTHFAHNGRLNDLTDELRSLFRGDLDSEHGADGAADADRTGERTADERTEDFVIHGRSSSYDPGLWRRRKVLIAPAAVTILVIVLVLVLSGRGASWPASVSTVRTEADRACQNPNVKSEPGQVDFACAKATRQVLWIFALMTSADKPGFSDPKTGRVGLEPITPQQGGELALSLDLHQPYNPADPVDSLEVAARAINNIIGGATLTGTDGRPLVQPGLESSAANCARYTGSRALTSRTGFPSLCTRPVTSPAGQAALAADAYRKWVVGAPASTVRDVAVLFRNAASPGAPQVQRILRHLPG